MVQYASHVDTPTPLGPTAPTAPTATALTASWVSTLAGIVFHGLLVALLASLRVASRLRRGA